VKPREVQYGPVPTHRIEFRLKTELGQNRLGDRVRRQTPRSRGAVTPTSPPHGPGSRFQLHNRAPPAASFKARYRKCLGTSMGAHSTQPKSHGAVNTTAPRAHSAASSTQRRKIAHCTARGLGAVSLRGASTSTAPARARRRLRDRAPASRRQAGGSRGPTFEASELPKRRGVEVDALE
jgi:hypothetical protein